MLIYGTKTTHLRTQNISGECRSCGTNNNLQLSVFQKYAHVFWIPFFPMGKVYMTQCSHCRHVLDENEIRNTYRSSYEEIKQQVKIPIWTFIGLGLLIILVVNIVISGKEEDKENKVWIQSPMKGDIYKFKTEDGQYSLLKVAEIKEDTIYVFENNYAATKITGLTKLLAQGDSTYSKFPYPFLKSELAKMLEDNDIIDIIRE